MKILFFDGYCSICNFFVDWGMSHDTDQKIVFASLQGETARQKLSDLDRQQDSETVIYLSDKNIYRRSEAILFFLKDIGGVWSMFFLFRMLPVFIRDFIYRRVARNRYRFFKRRHSCRIPTAAEKERLLP